MKKKLIIVAVGALVICSLLLSSGALAGKSGNGVSNGNGMPSGQHYNLNIIGVDKGDKPVGDSNGHTLFVKLDGRTKIYMTQDLDGEFKVVDRNGLDKDGAEFNIDSEPRYWDVYARALGKPGGKVNISAYGDFDLTDDLYLGSVEFDRKNGKPETVNINKLFYVTVTVDGKPYNNIWVFDIDELLEYYWDYNNEGLKLLQVRFYENTTYSPPS